MAVEDSAPHVEPQSNMVQVTYGHQLTTNWIPVAGGYLGGTNYTSIEVGIVRSNSFAYVPINGGTQTVTLGSKMLELDLSPTRRVKKQLGQ